MHLKSYLGFGLIQLYEINCGTTLLVFVCLLMLWRLYEPDHQQAWYWPQGRNIPSPSSEELTNWPLVTFIWRHTTWSTLVLATAGSASNHRWTNVVFSFRPFGTNLGEIWNQIQGNWFENAVCKVGTILSRFHCANRNGNKEPLNRVWWLYRSNLME